MTRKKTLGALLAGLLALALALPARAAGDDAMAHYFTNTEVVDQDGKVHRFYDDLIRGKKVLINFAFAHCTTACSPVTLNLARVQRQLGEHVGRDVQMLTLTVDPVNDTPEALRKFTKKMNVGPGWKFLTGSPESVHALLRRLGGYTDKPENHNTILIIGNAATGTWLKTASMNPPEQITHAVLHLDDDEAS
jgi:protein SCO1